MTSPEPHHRTPTDGRGLQVTVFIYDPHAAASADSAAAGFAAEAERLGHRAFVAQSTDFGQELGALLASDRAGDVVLFQHADAAYSSGSWPRVLGPLLRDDADVVIGHRQTRSLGEAALEKLAQFTLDGLAADVSSGQLGVRHQALVDLVLTPGANEAELLVKLARGLYRFAEVRIDTERTTPEWPALWRQAKTFVRYATTRDDADNSHDGYATLGNLENAAPHYNAWLGEQFRQFAGQRVLEVGAGIGTITAHLAAGRDKVIALEVDPFYVRRLKNRFRGQRQVVPHLSDVALADWRTLRAENIDTVVLSNVLEHIADDAQAVQLFARVLSETGRLLIFVPALPALFSSLDRAVGHHRRYTPDTLRAVLEENGFDVDLLKWMNVVGIPGWFVNGRVLKRQVLSQFQLRVYDQIAPMLASLESKVSLPVGLSLFCVATKRKV